MLDFFCVDEHRASLSNLHPSLHLQRTWQTENIAVFGCASALWHSPPYDHKLLYNHKQQFPFLHVELYENGAPPGQCENGGA